MKILFVGLLSLLLSSCWICPDPIYIQHDNQYHIIEVLSEDYYIKSIIITEFIPKKGFIELIDSSKITIEQKGPRATRVLKYTKSDEFYHLSDLKLNEFLKKKHLRYTVKLMKFENKKTGKQSDTETIVFVKDLANSIKKYVSKHPCP